MAREDDIEDAVGIGQARDVGVGGIHAADRPGGVGGGAVEVEGGDERVRRQPPSQRRRARAGSAPGVKRRIHR